MQSHWQPASWPVARAHTTPSCTALWRRILLSMACSPLLPFCPFSHADACPAPHTLCCLFTLPSIRRYRVLFSMRNIKGEVAHEALVKCEDGQGWRGLGRRKGRETETSKPCCPGKLRLMREIRRGVGDILLVSLVGLTRPRLPPGAQHSTTLLRFSATTSASASVSGRRLPPSRCSLSH